MIPGSPRPPRVRLPETNRYLDQVGPTPLVPVRIDGDGGREFEGEDEGAGATIWCKLEFLNPSGSTKDRIARYILGKALRRGEVAPGGTVVEASSGSTSIAMAMTAAQLGLRFVAVMPEGVSDERVLIIRSYGGEVVLTPRAEGMTGALTGACREAAARGAFQPLQFANPANPEAHRYQTAQEILAQVPGGSVDALVSGVGTGGTLVGLYQGFMDAGCSVAPFAARPVGGAGFADATGVECCSLGTIATHVHVHSGRIPGVVEGLSEIFARDCPPGLVTLDIPDDLALRTARRLIRRGFPVGPSSGLNFAAAVQAVRRLGPDSRVVTVFPDRMERYFSTELFRAVAE